MAYFRVSFSEDELCWRFLFEWFLISRLHPMLSVRVVGSRSS